MRIIRRLGNFIFHPFLWAVYPPLALLGRNIDQIPPGMAARSLLISVFMAALTLLFMRLVYRDWHKAGVVTSVLIIAFFSYGHVYALIEDKQVLGFMIGRHRFLGLVYVVVLGVILLEVWRRKDLRQATQAFNLVGLVMVLLPVYQITAYTLNSNLATAQLRAGMQTQNMSELKVPEGQVPPDIYYIILDTYTRDDVLQEQFGYDNLPFLQELEELGFYTASCSQSNYSSTALSLTSSFNMSYLSDLDPNLSPPNTNDRDLYPYLWNNRVVNALQKLGYQIHVFESGYSPTDFHFADFFYSQVTDLLGIIWTDGINPYESLFLTTSAGIFVYEISPDLPEAVQKFLSLETSYIVHRNRILYTLNRLERLGSESGPKFVFVHILAPHNPFVFGPNGEHLERETPFTLNDDREVLLLEDYKAGYIAQVNYLNQRVLAAVKRILAESAQPPIILIQGDHGVPRLVGYTNAILNTYLLPGYSSKLYASISPVNSFRIILDSYLGGSLGLLRDESCVSTNANPFACEPVSEPNPNCVVTKPGMP